MNTPNIELLPCPMCGFAATFVKHSAGMPGTMGFDKWDAVACKHCGTTVGACDRRFRCREDAAKAWNLRTQPPKDAERGPMTEAQDLDTVYWLDSGGRLPMLMVWADRPADFQWLSEARCFRTEADALAARTTGGSTGGEHGA